MEVKRRARGVLLLVGAGLVVAAAWVGLQPQTPEQRLQRAEELAASVRVAATVTGSSLLAARAIADFGVGGEVRLVRVRILETMHLQLQLETTWTSCSAAHPGSVSSGRTRHRTTPGSAIGAGVTRTWPPSGRHVGADANGRVTLHRGEPIEFAVDLRRGDSRCDYAPGTWGIELWLAPVIDGVATADLLANDGRCGGSVRGRRSPHHAG